MRNNTILACVYFIIGVLCLAAKNIVVEPAESHKGIDQKRTTEFIQKVMNGSAKEKEQQFKNLLVSPGDYAPPALYLASSVLFDNGSKESAMFWYYTGQLRARIDANICADITARSAVEVLNQTFGPKINQYAITDMNLLKKTIERVIRWEARTPCNYDRRWINLHGVGAFTGEKTLSKPKEEWEKIRKETREEYLKSFYSMLEKTQKPS